MRFTCAVLFTAVVAATDLELDYEAPYASPKYAGWGKTLASVRNVFGTMNGPVPVQTIQQGKPANIVEDADGYAASFDKLGGSTGWVRFNDLGCDARLSISCIFSGWPSTQAELEATDVDALAAEASRYNFTGIDSYVGGAAAAGRNVDFRIGDCHSVASLYGTDYPAFGFPVNYNDPKGIALFTAVATEVAMHVHATVLARRRETSQRLFFDLFTETSEDGGVFWPGTAKTYAHMFGSVMNSIRGRLDALAAAGSPHVSNVQFVGANTFYSGSATKRAYFSAFLAECAAMGRAACPLDVVAFHPFTTQVSTLLDQYAYATEQVRKYFGGAAAAAWGAAQPRIAITAWGLHGSGQYDMNREVEGAAYIGQILAAMQSLPLEFSIYYKFNGFNCLGAKAPCLVAAASGALKPNAMPFVLNSLLAAEGSQRLVASLGEGADASRGYGVVAVNATDAVVGSGVSPKVAVFLAGNSKANKGVTPARLKVSNWPCVNQMATLTLRTMRDGDARTGEARADFDVLQVRGAVRGDSLFHAFQNNTAYGPLPVWGADHDYADAYAALLSLECGDTTRARGASVDIAQLNSAEEQQDASGSAPHDTAAIAGGAAAAAVVVAALAALFVVRRRQRATAAAGASATPQVDSAGDYTQGSPTQNPAYDSAAPDEAGAADDSNAL